MSDQLRETRPLSGSGESGAKELQCSSRPCGKVVSVAASKKALPRPQPAWCPANLRVFRQAPYLVLVFKRSILWAWWVLALATGCGGQATDKQVFEPDADCVHVPAYDESVPRFISAEVATSGCREFGEGGCTECCSGEVTFDEDDVECIVRDESGEHLIPGPCDPECPACARCSVEDEETLRELAGPMECDCSTLGGEGLAQLGFDPDVPCARECYHLMSAAWGLPQQGVPGVVMKWGRRIRAAIWMALTWGGSVGRWRRRAGAGAWFRLRPPVSPPVCSTRHRLRHPAVRHPRFDRGAVAALIACRFCVLQGGAPQVDFCCPGSSPSPRPCEGTARGASSGCLVSPSPWRARSALLVRWPWPGGPNGEREVSAGAANVFAGKSNAFGRVHPAAQRAVRSTLSGVVLRRRALELPG